MFAITKEFVSTYTIKAISNFKPDTTYCSEVKEYYYIPWRLHVNRRTDQLEVYLSCDQLGTIWSVQANVEVKLRSPNGSPHCKTAAVNFNSEKPKENSWGWKQFADWEKVAKNFVIEDELHFEVHVQILKASGIKGRDPVLKFDNESMGELSDVVLVVDEQRFHVLRKHLALQCSYFKSLFFGSFGESKKSEVTLSGIDPEAFQTFLEVLYLEDSIDDNTVEGILQLADMYDSRAVIGRCEKFLYKESDKSGKKKLELAIRYKLEKLEIHCCNTIKTIQDVRSIIAGNIEEMNPSLMKRVLKRVLEV